MSDAMPVASNYWERKAEKARATAKNMVDPKARTLMLSVARRCETVATIISKQDRKPKSK
jgi:hypothetical protein